ncbi:MAG: hypothetical protein Q4G16_09395, partial [Cruoricaptor ignavus]|nr:hypothetical protein [Cruoricaptor ignavus]
MKKIILFTMLFVGNFAFSQQSKFEVSLYAGAQNNFFVNYGRDVKKSKGVFQPIEEYGYDLYQKNSVGSVYGG